MLTPTTKESDIETLKCTGCGGRIEWDEATTSPRPWELLCARCSDVRHAEEIAADWQAIDDLVNGEISSWSAEDGR